MPPRFMVNWNSASFGPNSKLLSSEFPISAQAHGRENPPELLITHQAAVARRSLLDCRLLDRGQDRAALLGRDRNAQFLAFQANAVEAAFLAENDPTLCSNQFGRVGLDRFGKWNWLATAPLSRRKNCRQSTASILELYPAGLRTIPTPRGFSPD